MTSMGKWQKTCPSSASRYDTHLPFLAGGKGKGYTSHGRWRMESCLCVLVKQFQQLLITLTHQNQVVPYSPGFLLTG